MADWNPKANDLFVRAAEIADTAEREAFLDEQCGGDAGLLAQVNAMLSIGAKVGNFLNQPAVGGPVGTGYYQSAGFGVGTVIGPYKLLQEIGEGGFGVVYMAEQEQPLRRMVALKVIKAGMDTAQVIARFESERQALAILDHPNIAKVFDAGATESGRPYFVMELVKGVPITEFCDKNHMRAEDRLKLFIEVCHAIQHAHHKGVIHRDIKPSNVLVTLHDGVPVVKVIDFGVAKATAQKLTERTLFTAFGQMIGTPAYMSPEQAEMSGLDIDTRSDIYSLGVLLYELLTGTTPLDIQELRKAGYAEMQRLIREEEPPRPSTRLSSLGDSATILAGNRGSDVNQLARLLAGDLDWIVMKALDKDRNRRYGTPGNFAEDIERYLRRDAILARPPTSAYRLKKFMQRNRTAVLAAAAISAALLVGTAVAIWQAVVATHARAVALEAAAAEKKAKETAEVKEAETRAVLDFVQDKILAAARPQGQEGGLGRDVTLRKALEAALPFVESGFKDQPLIESRLRRTLGMSFGFLGEARLSAEQFEKTLAIDLEHLGRDHPHTLRSMQNLAISYGAVGRDDEALRLREDALRRQQATLGPEHPDILTAMNNLAISYVHVGRYADALKLGHETLSLNKATFGPDHPDTLRSMQNLATMYDRLGRHAEALSLREEALTLQKAKLGPDHPDTLFTMMGLANSYTNTGRQAEALKLNEETLALKKSKLGPDHPDTLGSMMNLANAYSAMGRHEDALKLNDDALKLRRKRLGIDHPDTLLSMHSIAAVLDRAGRQAEALKLLEDTLELRKAKLGADHPQTLQSMRLLGIIYANLGRYAEVKSLREEALRLSESKLGAEHPDTLDSMNDVAWLLATSPDPQMRDLPRAVELAAAAAEAAPKHPSYRGTLGVARYRAGDWKGAVPDLEKAINLRQPDDPSRASEGFSLAMANWQLGQKDEARAWFDKSVAWMDKAKKDEAELKRFRAEAAELLGVSEKP